MKTSLLKFGKTLMMIMFLALSAMFNKVNANVTVTAPTLTVYACSTFPTGYYALGNIVISEDPTNGLVAHEFGPVGAGKTLILTAPTNFEFQATTGSISCTPGKNLSVLSIAVTTTTITATFSVSSTPKVDVLTISGIMVRGIGSASGPSNILRLTGVAGGTATISGDLGGAGINHGTLTSAAGTAVSAASAGTDQSLCANTGTLAGTAPAAGLIGTWTVTAGSATITSPNSNTSGLTAIGAGANTLTWTITSASCTGSLTDDVIITNNTPTTSNAGTDQNLCVTYAVLAGNTPTIGTGAWSLISGAGTFITPTSPASDVSNLGLGSNTYRWTITNGVCTSSDDITINVSTPCTNCVAGGSNGTIGSITNVTFNTINRTSGFDGYISTGLSTTVTKTVSYNLNVSRTNASTYNLYTEAWIDWNGDGLFSLSEIVMPSALDATAGVSTRTVSVTVPSYAGTGTMTMRVMMKYNAAPNADGCDVSTTAMDVEDYNIYIPAQMLYVSSTTTQANTSNVFAATFSNEIIGVQVVTFGAASPLSATSFTFNTTGTTNAASDILNAKLWSTGSSSTFSAVTQIGATIASPSGPFTFTPSATLSMGTNYFWLTYDIPVTATAPDVVDATCTSVTVGSAHTPTVTAPAGNRPIIVGTLMSYQSSTCTQSATTCPRPSTDNLIIGIQVVTTGSTLAPLTATTFSFNTTGTSPVVTTNIQNAKLYYTGLSSTFATTTQVGSTVAAPSGAYTITPATSLALGTNYFWLTYDIPAGAGCNPTQADAQCTNILISTINRTPTVTAPLGAIVLDCNVPYYSAGSFPANALSSWNTMRDGTGFSPASFNSGYTFYVQNGHSMTTSGAVTIPYLTLEAGGYVTASQLITMTELRIKSYATFEQQVAAGNAAYITNFYIENYGTWIHNNPGYLANASYYFAPNSNQYFYQYGAGTFPTGIAWGNVLFNSTTGGNWDFGHCLNTIQGNLTITKVGTGNWFTDGFTETINIGGNLTINGGWWKMVEAYVTCAAPATLTVNVSGDFTMSSGILEDYNCGSSTQSILNIGGNVSITGGTMNMNNSPTPSSINLTGGSSSVNWSQTGGSITLGNTNIKTGKTVILTGSKIGDVAASRAITVETGGILMCGNYTVQGTGSFAMQSDATLGIGSIAGITASGNASGNILTTGGRTYHSAGNYIYYEGLSPQATGNFAPSTSPTASTIGNLTINKNLATQSVSLTNAFSVVTATTLTLGELNLNSNTLTQLSSATTAITGAAAGVSYIKSETNAATNPSIVQWNMGATNGTYIIPFGISTAADGYIPFTFTKTAGSSNVQFATRATAADNTPWESTVTDMTSGSVYYLDASTPSVIDRWWEITPLSGTNSVTADLVFTYRGAENTTSYSGGLFNAQHWNGIGWDPGVGNATGVTGAATGSLSVSGVNTFSPWVITSASAPLPIELVNLEATCESGNTIVNWTTASETNNDYFTLEKSNDGESFIKIGYVKAAGNSNTIKNYSWTDNNSQGISYYRLTQTDYDGRTKTFKLVSSDCGNEDASSINAYSYDGTVTITIQSFINDNYTASIYDGQGRKLISKLFSAEKGNSVYQIDIQQLTSGLYHLVIENAKNNFSQRLFVK